MAASDLPDRPVPLRPGEKASRQDERSFLGTFSLEQRMERGFLLRDRTS